MDGAIFFISILYRKSNKYIKYYILVAGEKLLIIHASVIHWTRCRGDGSDNTLGVTGYFIQYLHIETRTLMFFGMFVTRLVHRDEDSRKSSNNFKSLCWRRVRVHKKSQSQRRQTDRDEVKKTKTQAHIKNSRRTNAKNDAVMFDTGWRWTGTGRTNWGRADNQRSGCVQKWLPI